MGAKPWSHFTPYQIDINAALQSLKEQEFRAGRYGFEYWHRNIQAILGTQDLVSNAVYGDELYDANPSPDELIEQYGDVQAAMDALLNQSSDVGTMSILDMISISEEPGPCAVCPLSEDEMQEIF